MASIYGAYNNYTRLRIDYSISQSIEHNNSGISLYLYAERTKNSHQFNNSGQSFWSLSGTGNNYANFDWAANSSELFLGSTTLVVAHNTDGTAETTLSGYWYTGRTGSSYIPEALSISQKITLPTIPRASTITCSTANIESNATVTITSASTSFTHSVYAYFGSQYVAIATNQKGGSFSWKIPTSFYEQIPDDPSGIGTIYCETYNNGTLIGVKTASFTVTTNIEKCRPTVTGTVVDTNSTTIALTGNKNKLVLGKSTAQITVTPVAKNSATIKTVTIDGVATTNNTRTIANVSKASFPITVTDSREYPSAAYSVTASGGSVPYEDLSFNATIFRPQPTGTEIQMKYSGKYYNGSFGAVSNTLSITWKYKVKGATSWTNGGTITPTLSGNTISAKTISLGTSYNYQTAYEFQIVAVDKLTTITQTIPLSVGMPVFYWGKDFLKVVGTLYPLEEISKNSRIAKLPRGWLNADKSFDEALTTGVYDVDYSALNGPFQTWGYLDVQVANGDTWDKSGNWIWQTFYQTGGAIYQRSATNGGSFSPWQRIYRETSLYNNSSGTSGTVTLSETSANFSYLEIFYVLNGNIFKSVRVLSPDGKRIVLDGVWVAADMGLIQIETKTYTISGQSITPQTESWYANLVTSGVGALGVQDTLKIFKVIGYK